jgi:hypothetical protein
MCSVIAANMRVPDPQAVKPWHGVRKHASSQCAAQMDGTHTSQLDKVCTIATMNPGTLSVTQHTHIPEL